MPDNQGEYVRTKQDATTILQHANIDLDILESPSQALYFGDKLRSSILLELDPALSQNIHSGRPFRFLGSVKDKLILCTQNATYDVKSAQTSNSMLVISSLQLPSELNNENDNLLRRDICSIHHSYLEVKRIKPDIRLVRVLLDKNPYQGPELEPDQYCHENDFFTTEDLLEHVQISEEELLEILNSIDALQVLGYWRILGFEFHFRALSFLINLIDENSWGLSSLPMGETLKDLKELVPDYIAEHIFSIYCTATGAVEDDEQIFELNKKKVCRFLAAALLSHADKFNLNDFIIAWRQGVPDGMDVQLDMIKDMILLDGHSDSTKSISYFPEHDLSGNIQERFRQLFKAKSMWTYDEIEPFLINLSSEKQDVKALLTKYTRSSNQDNATYYFPKYGK